MEHQFLIRENGAEVQYKEKSKFEDIIALYCTFRIGLLF